MTAAAARPRRPAKPTCMLLRAELGVVLGEVAALVAVAVRLVEGTDVGARLELGGAVADAAAEETEAIIELVASTTLEVAAAALLEDPTADVAEALLCDADPAADEAPAPRQLESELDWM